jgi:hypothetical protein
VYFLAAREYQASKSPVTTTTKPKPTMNIPRYILRVAAVSLLALTLLTANSLLAQDKPATAQAQSNLAKSLLGTWILVGEPGKVGKAPAAGGRLKFFTGRHWTITSFDPETRVTIYHHGGTYTLNGDEYVETIEYANERNKQLIKQTFKFTIKVEGDTLTQIGINNAFNEVWKRVK